MPMRKAGRLLSGFVGSLMGINTLRKYFILVPLPTRPIFA